MKRIYKSDEIEVLSIEGLKYTTKFDHLEEDSTHIPVFDKEQERYFIHMGDELRGFTINKIVYGFRYYDEDGNLSPMWTAIFCNLDKEDSECVILGKYWQNYDADLLDNLSPYDDLPCGRFHFESSKPKVFYKSEKNFVNNQRYFPKLCNVNANHRLLTGYQYDVDRQRAVKVDVPVELYCIDQYNGITIIRNEIDNKNIFEYELDCIKNYRQKILDSKKENVHD